MMRRLPARMIQLCRALVILMSFTLPGCGDNEVVVSVDILSFVDPEVQTGVYTVPPGVMLPPTTIEPQEITLPGGLAEALVIEDVALSFTIDFIADAPSGQGTVGLELYLAAGDSAQGGSSVYQSPPVHQASIVLPAGTTTTHSAQIEATQANGLVSAFQSGEVLFGMALAYDATGSTMLVSGQWVIRRIDAVVAGTRDAF